MVRDTSADSTERAAERRRGRRGFTMAEVLFSILIIGLLMGLLILGLRQAANFARDQALTATVRNMGIGADQFRTDFGLTMPMVYDGGGNAGSVTLGPMLVTGPGGTTGEPIDTSGTTPVVNAWSARDIGFLRGRELSNGTVTIDPVDRYNPRQPPHYLLANQRYSKMSLAYYLVGSLGEDIDGVGGPGITRVRRTGVFARSGETYGPYFDPDGGSASVETAYVDPVEYTESLRDDVEARAFTDADLRYRHAVVDPNGKAYRYYRWEHEDPVGSAVDLNIPAVLLDPEVLQNFTDASTAEQSGFDLTDGDAELRAATWAIVGAGQNGVFGTETLDVIASALGVAVPESAGGQADLRNRAWADNLVEVGR